MSGAVTFTFLSLLAGAIPIDSPTSEEAAISFYAFGHLRYDSQGT